MAEYVRYHAPKGPKLYRFGKYSISEIEIKHLSIAFVMLALTLYVRQFKDSLLTTQSLQSQLSSFAPFILAFALGFILHEFAHKFVAQRYGFISEFRADMFMLVLMFVMALFLPVIFLAPGAVMILTRHITIRQNGIISVAGPIVNLALSVIGIIIYFFITQTGFLGLFAVYLIWINAFLGTFNMLPFWILDGKKVLVWNKLVYFSVLIPLVLLLVIFVF